MTPRFDGFEAKIRDSFARQDMMRTLGATLDGIAPGKVDIACPVLPEMRQQHGFAHAAVSFAIGDSAAGYAALSLMPPAAAVLTARGFSRSRGFSISTQTRAISRFNAGGTTAITAST